MTAEEERAGEHVGRYALKRADRLLALLPNPQVMRDAVVALQHAERRFELIRISLVRNLEEPERQAFWIAVEGRDEARAALAAIGLPGGGE